MVQKGNGDLESWNHLLKVTKLVRVESALLTQNLSPAPSTTLRAGSRVSHILTLNVHKDTHFATWHKAGCTVGVQEMLFK